MTGKILAVSLNPAIDISSTAKAVKPTIKIRTSNQVHDPGGCGVNVARVIATLGGKPELVYLEGGATGAFLTEILGKYPIMQHAIPGTGMTRISYAVRDLSAGLEYRFVPEGAAITASEIQQVVDMVERLDFDYIVLTGSLPHNAPDEIYARFAGIAAGKGARVILDSSGRALAKTIDQTCVFLMKPSLEELEMLVGKSLDARLAGEEALQLIREGAAENIVVSMGADGALLVRDSDIRCAPAAAVTVGSAVGAGDSVVGAMAFALANDIAIEEAFYFGVAAGSAAVITLGTELCRREDVIRLYKQQSRTRDQRQANGLLQILEQ